MKIKILFFFILALLLVFQTSVIAQAATSVNLFQITTDGSQQTQPLIDRDLVAYTNHGGSQGIDIWGYDLDNKENFPIIEKSGQQFLTGLHNDLLVYEDVDDLSNYDVHLYNMKKEEDTEVASGAAAQGGGVTDGKYVVYVNGGACGTIQAYNIKKKTTMQISSSGCSPLSISDGTVVWANGAPGGTNIYGYNFKKNTSLDVVVDPDFQESPNIFNDSVVYVEYTTGALGDYQAIKMKNIHTGEKKTIYETTTSTVQSPSISDKYVVWSESTAQHVGGVQGANLKTGEVFEIQEQGPHQNSHTTTSVWKNTAVWMAWRTGNGDIYGAEFKH